MSSMIHWLNANSGSIQTIATLILAIVTTIYVILMWKNVKLIQKAEEERNRPRIYIYIQQCEDDFKIVDLIIGNYGLGAATDIKFSLNEDLETIGEGRKLSTIEIIKNGSKYLAPQQILRIPLLFVPGRFNELIKKNIVISVIYKSMDGKIDFAEKFPLDFNTLVKHKITKD